MPSLLDEYTAPVTTNAELGDFIAWLNERWLPEIKRLAGGEPRPSLAGIFALVTDDAGVDDPAA